MNTTLLLLAEHGTADVPLETVAQQYFGIGAKAAVARALKAELPFPAYRPGSQKSPWLVRITDWKYGKRKPLSILPMPGT